MILNILNLNNKWIRAILSLFLGGALQELFRIKTGNDNSNVLIFGASLSFVILTVLVYLINKIKLKNAQANSQKDSIIDDL